LPSPQSVPYPLIPRQDASYVRHSSRTVSAQNVIARLDRRAVQI